jgi:hypothetical protein
MTGEEKETWTHVENLEDALTHRVQQTPIRLGQADITTIYYSAMQKALPDMATQYNATWQTMSGITEGMKNTRTKYLTGQLPTAKNLCRYKVKKTPLCPCSKVHPDSGHHAVAWCPAIMGMVQEKHNKVVRCITKAIAQGDKGAHHIAYTDGGQYQKWADNQAPKLHRPMNNLPRDLITPEELRQCKSKPDIIMYQEVRTRDPPKRTSPDQTHRNQHHRIQIREGHRP